MRYVEATGASVEEAEERVRAQAALERNEKIVQMEVLSQPTRGLFGVIGSDGARVRLHIEKDQTLEITSLLKEWLERLGIVAEFKTGMEEEEFRINLTGKDVGILIGKYGKTLDALQYLLNIVFNRGNEQKLKIGLDVEGYRSNREKTLKNIARRAAIKVLNTGKTVELDPMPPLDRRIIHLALKSHSGVTTFSKGTEPRRKIVVALKGRAGMAPGLRRDPDPEPGYLDEAGYDDDD